MNAKKYPTFGALHPISRAGSNRKALAPARVCFFSLQLASR